MNLSETLKYFRCQEKQAGGLLLDAVCMRNKKNNHLQSNADLCGCQRRPRHSIRSRLGSAESQGRDDLIEATPGAPGTSL